MFWTKKLTNLTFSSHLLCMLKIDRWRERERERERGNVCVLSFFGYNWFVEGSVGLGNIFGHGLHVAITSGDAIWNVMLFETLLLFSLHLDAAGFVEESKFRRIGVPTRDSFSRRILKACNLGQVKARCHYLSRRCSSCIQKVVTSVRRWWSVGFKKTKTILLADNKMSFFQMIPVPGI